MFIGTVTALMMRNDPLWISYAIYLNSINFPFQIGPEKGAIHIAVAGIINALWDLWARIEGKVRDNSRWLNHFHIFG